MTGRVRAFARALTVFGPADWWGVLRAQMALIAARGLLATRPRGRLIAPRDERPTAGGDGDQADAAVPALALRLALDVDRAATYGLFRPQCLVRALALHRMLERHGVRGSRIRIGVRREGDGGAFQAHAWVELGDRVLDDRPEHVRTFVPLTDARLARGVGP